MILIPLAMPVIVLGLGAFQFFVRYRANGTLWSIALVHAVLGVPYVFLTARATPSDQLRDDSVGDEPGRRFVRDFALDIPAAAGAGGGSGALLAFVIVRSTKS